MWKTLKSGEILFHVEGHIFCSRVYEAIHGSIRKINSMFGLNCSFRLCCICLMKRLPHLKLLLRAFLKSVAMFVLPGKLKFFYTLEAKIESEFNPWSVLKINKLMNTIANSLFQFQSLIILMDMFQANGTLIYSNCLSTHTCQK